MNVNCTRGNHWLHHNTWSLLHTTPQTINLSLKPDHGWVPLSLEILDCATFSPIMQSKMGHTLCWKVSLHNPIRHKFTLLFENMVPGSLKSFQSDQQVKICIYLTEATILYRSRELTDLKPSWYTFTSISLFGFPDFKINFIVKPN